ncbi:MAG TPA: flavoprotein [Anaerohalosphaeraceae bacterium]|nr:flavoprotein [Anaerohalosphaeraceae bacterium]
MAVDLSILANKKIVLGVAGGIAAYKAADLASKLTSAGAAVRTILTEAAQKLIGAKTFEALTGQPVYIDLWSAPEEFQIGHVQTADWADALVVAPATADILAKTAAGICDDLLSTTLCVCWEKPILMAPAMNTRMWTNPATRQNIQTLTARNIRFVGPAAGRLACGTEGIGRMAEPAEILEALIQLFRK